MKFQALRQIQQRVYMYIRRSLVVNATPMETRIALLENGQPCELFIERTTHVSHVGDVYKGRVAKLLLGMQSAFIAVGASKDGFLYLDEPEAHRISTEEIAELDEDQPDTAVLEFPVIPPSLPPIKEGEEILVQVVKDPINTKGPRLSRHLSFPGRFLVFMPSIEHVGISRKITDIQERERLRELIRSHSLPGEGFIVRTAAIGEKDEDLVADVAFLRDVWRDVQAKAEGMAAPNLVWQDSRLLQKVLRDLFREEVASFWVDDPDTYEEVVAFVSKLHPEWVERVKLFTSDIPIFEAFGIEQEIDAARSPKVFLKHGGSLVINQTEALVSVDVNTGKFVGKKDLEDTVFQTNLEAIPEIVRQLRLRNLGGIIVVDFIDMADEAHRNEVMALLAEELLRDRNHARAERISAFGLVEMTRKRTGPSLERQLTETCSHCQGMGRMLSAETVMLKAYREMARQGEHLRGSTVRLSIHPDLRAALSPEMREGMLSMARAFGAHILWVEKTEGPRHGLGMEILPPKG